MKTELTPIMKGQLTLLFLLALASGSLTAADKPNSPSPNDRVRRGKFGTPGTTWNVGAAWAHVSDTPLTFYKRTEQSGGVTTSFLAHWPAAVKPRAAFEDQPCHVIDLLPTLIEIGEGQYPADTRITGLKTPNLDQLAAESVVFTRAFCGQSVCSPSKGAIYTGLAPHANGIWRNVFNHATPGRRGPEEWIPLPSPLTKENDPSNLGVGGIHEDLTNIIQRLKAADSYCALSGKLHVQPSRQFPYDVFVRTGDLDAVIQGAGGRPWLFWCNPGTTHAPWWRHVQGANKLTDPKNRNSAPRDVDPAAITMLPWFPDTPAARIDLAQYYSCVRIIDEFVGAMLANLEASGQADRTLVIFTGDHGIPCVCDGRFYYIANVIQERTTLPEEKAVNIGTGFGEYGDPGPQYAIDLHDETVRQKSSQPLPYGLLRQLCMGDAPKEELYDLDADPWAVKNLAADPAHATALEAMRAEMRHWREFTADADIPPSKIKRRTAK